MPYKITIASGKGGTGKTTVAANLFYFLSKTNLTVQLLDCDVEEPNCQLFFKQLKPEKKAPVNQLIPTINNNACSFCKKCQEYCEFNAISVIPNARFAEINPDLCHSCGACSLACNFMAINEYQHEIGILNFFKFSQKAEIIEGRLKVGSPMQTMVIKSLKKWLNPLADYTIFDSPPGTSCPVVETISDADFIILVTEPTPFGLYDLKLTIQLVKDIRKPFGVIINKAGLGNNEVYRFIEQENIPLLGEIPFNETYASSYASGNIFSEIPDQIAEVYQTLLNKIRTVHPVK